MVELARGVHRACMRWQILGAPGDHAVYEHMYRAGAALTQSARPIRRLSP